MNRFNSARGMQMSGEATMKQIEYAQSIHELHMEAIDARRDW